MIFGYLAAWFGATTYKSITDIKENKKRKNNSQGITYIDSNGVTRLKKTDEQVYYGKDKIGGDNCLLTTNGRVVVNYGDQKRNESYNKLLLFRKQSKIEMKEGDTTYLWSYRMQDDALKVYPQYKDLIFNHDIYADIDTDELYVEQNIDYTAFYSSDGKPKSSIIPVYIRIVDGKAVRPSDQGIKNYLDKDSNIPMKRYNGKTKFQMVNDGIKKYNARRRIIHKGKVMYKYLGITEFIMTKEEFQ